MSTLSHSDEHTQPLQARLPVRMQAKFDISRCIVQTMDPAWTPKFHALGGACKPPHPTPTSPIPLHLRSAVSWDEQQPHPPPLLHVLTSHTPAALPLRRALHATISCATAAQLPICGFTSHPLPLMPRARGSYMLAARLLHDCHMIDMWHFPLRRLGIVRNVYPRAHECLDAEPPGPVHQLTTGTS